MSNRDDAMNQNTRRQGEGGTLTTGTDIVIVIFKFAATQKVDSLHSPLRDEFIKTIKVE